MLAWLCGSYCQSLLWRRLYLHHFQHSYLDSLVFGWGLDFANFKHSVVEILKAPAYWAVKLSAYSFVGCTITVAESHKVESPPREVTCPCRPRLRVSGVRLSLGESMRRAMRIQRDRRRIRSRDLDINSTLEYLCTSKLNNYE